MTDEVPAPGDGWKFIPAEESPPVQVPTLVGYQMGLGNGFNESGVFTTVTIYTDISFDGNVVRTPLGMSLEMAKGLHEELGLVIKFAEEHPDQIRPRRRSDS